MHTPVFVQQAIEALNLRSDGVYIDCTAGEGGHIREIAKTARVLGIDWDARQVQKLRAQFAAHTNVYIAQGNYADVAEIATQQNFDKVDGILFDLGLSFEQMMNAGKGFSYKQLNDPLDMRIGDSDTTVAELLNNLSEQELYELLAKYSEEIHSKEIAKTFVEFRRSQKFETVRDLVTAIDLAASRFPTQHNRFALGLYAQIFQALRIAVNHEFENIKKGLEGAVQLIKPEGRIVVITFHSLEDRVVKQFARTHNLKLLKIQPAQFSDLRSFERSAHLRVITKI